MAFLQHRVEDVASQVAGLAAAGLGGAAGAGTSAALVPQLAQALDQTDLPHSVKSAALASAGTLLGAAVGGSAGAAAALGETANNFLSHPEARQREAAHQRLLQCTDDSCRREARQEIARLDALDEWRDRQVADACLTPSSALCQGWHAALAEARQSYTGYVARDDLTQSVAGERRQVNEQEFLYRRRIADPFAYGMAKGLMKLTPPAMALGVGLTSYELTKAIIDVGLAETAVAIGQGLVGLPADLKGRLNSDDPAVRGEALVDTLALTSVSTVIVGKLQQSGNKALTRVLDEQAKVAAERAKSAKSQIELNNRRDDLDAYFEYKQPDGSWNWPKNDGALPGTIKNITLEKGQSIDRYGSDLGHYAAPLGELAERRSLAPGGPAEVYRRYEVIKPIPSVNASITAPAFGSEGGGVQFRFEKPLRWYVENGYLKEVK